MITVHEKNATDFTGLGLGALDPRSCVISELAGGMFELELEQPVTDDGRHLLLDYHRIIKAPAPVREAPSQAYTNQTPAQSTTVTREMWKVVTSGQRFRLYLCTEPTSNAPHIQAYDPGTRVIKLQDVGVVDNQHWFKVQIKDGGTIGYMASQAQYGGVWYDYLERVSSEDVTETIQGDNPGKVVEPTQAREQLFRIYNVVRDAAENLVTVRAQHITYDLKGTIYTGTDTFEDVPANTAISTILSHVDHAHPFQIYCGVTDAITGDYSGRNLISIICSPDDGILKQTGARLIRDNYSIYIVPDSTRDLGIRIWKGKNLLEGAMETDCSSIITKIIPQGTDAEGEPLIGEPVLSSHINDYPVVYTKQITYDEHETDDVTREQVLEALAADAQKDFDDGVDLPSINISAEFVRTELIPDFTDIATKSALHLYDTAGLCDPDQNLYATLRMTSYEYDALAERYTDTGLGKIETLQPTVYGYEIAGGISGTKIVAGSMPGTALRSLSVPYAAFTEATVRHLSADSIDAVTAYVQNLVSQQITTDELYAGLAEIALAQITTANISTANIDWANIQSLTAEIARIAEAEIGTATIDWAQITEADINKANINWANVHELSSDIADITSATIGTADIGYAQIKNLSAESLIAYDAVTHKYFISELSVDGAQIVDLLVNNLYVKNSNNELQQITVDATTGKVTGGSLLADRSVNGSSIIIENSITASELNVSQIFADQALIRAVKAANIDVENLFAAQATINQLNALDIRGNKYLRLLVTNAANSVSSAGDNLLLKTQEYDKGNSADKAELTGETYHDCAVRYFDNRAGSSSYTYYARRNYTFTRSTTYTFSFWAKGSGQIKAGVAGAATETDLYGINGATGLGSSSPIVFDLSADWQRYWVQIATRPWSVETAAKNIYISIAEESDAYTAGWKLELGSEATMWTPAPSEMPSYVTSAELALAEDSITATVTSTVQADIDGLTTRVENAESSISQQADQIALRVTKSEFDKLAVGGRNLLANTAAYPKGNSADKAELNGDTYQGCKVRYYDNTEGTSQYIYARKSFTFEKSAQYVFSFWTKGSGQLKVAVSGSSTETDLTGSNGDTGAGTTAPVSFALTDSWQRYWVKIAPRDWSVASASKNIYLYITSGAEAYTAGWKIETGTVATDWTPAEEDLDSRYATTSQLTVTDGNITALTTRVGQNETDIGSIETRADGIELTVQNITTNGVDALDTGSTGVSVKINKTLFNVDVPGTNGDLVLDKDGGHLSKAIVGELVCDGVAKAYAGPTSISVGKSTSTFLSMRQALKSLSDCVLTKDVTITVQADLFERCVLSGVSGTGVVNINGGGYTLQGRLTVHQCAAKVYVNGLNVTNDGAFRSAVFLATSAYVAMYNCRVDGNDDDYSTHASSESSRTYGIFVEEGTKARLRSCKLFRASSLVFADLNSEVIMANCGGGENTYFLDMTASVAHLYGTRPAGSFSKAYGSICEPADPAALTINYGGTRPAVTPTATVEIPCSNSGTYSGGWESGSNILQGSYSGTASAGCMWFDTSAFSGKTVKSATLTIHRSYGWGTWMETSLYLRTTTATGKSGNPTATTTSHGIIGALEEDKTSTFDLPVAAVQLLANGTRKGLMLYYAGDESISGKSYTRNYSCYSGYDSSSAPVLTVTYES